MRSSWRQGTRATLGLFVASLALLLTVGVSPSVAVSVARLDASQDLVAPTFPPHTSLSTAVGFLDRSLALRMRALTQLSSKIASAKSLPQADRAALVAEVVSDSQAMASLQSKGSTETSVAAVMSDLSTMVLSYHVLAFVDPQVHAVLAADANLAEASQLLSQEAALSAAIAAASQAHENVSRERSLEVTFRARLTALSGAVTGLPASLLGLEPSDVPGCLPALTTAALANTRAAADGADAASAEQLIVSLLAKPV